MDLRVMLLIGVLCWSGFIGAETGERPEAIQAVVDEWELEKEEKLDDADLVGELSRVVVFIHQQGKYEEGLELAQIIYTFAEQQLGDKHPKTLSSVNNLATLYLAQGRYGEAEPLYLRALNVSEAVLSKEHPQTLRSVNNLATLYLAQGRYGEAEPLYLRALNVCEAVLGKEHSQTLSSVNNLAGLYRVQGRYGEAEPLYLRALNVREAVLGKEHPDTLSSVNSLAMLYQDQGRYGEAEPLYLRALNVREAVLGKEHPDTLSSANNLAFLYQTQGRYGEAEPLYLRALNVSEAVLGKEHPDTLINVNNLAGLYLAQGRYGEAEPLYLRSLNISEAVLGKEHPNTLTSVNNLAGLYWAQSRYGEAEPLYLRSLNVSEAVLGKEHPDTLTSVNSLAMLYQAQGRYGEAEPLFQRALQAYRATQGEYYPDTLSVRFNLATLLLQQKKYKVTLKQLKAYQQGLLTLTGRELHQEVDLRDKRQLLFKYSVFQDLSYTLALQASGVRYRQFAATVLMRWHQVEAEEQLFLQRLMRHSDSPKVQTLAQQLKNSREALSTAMLNIELKSETLHALQKQLQDQEQQLSQHSKTFERQLRIRHSHADDLQGALPSKSGLLMLRVFKPLNLKTGEWDKLHWLAVWLAENQDGEAQYQFFDLGEVEKSKKLWEQAKESQTPEAYQALYRHFFQNLDKHFKQVDTLYFTTDHFLHLDDFAHWRLADGRFWLERQQLRRLSSARDLLRPTAQGASSGDLIALGGIDYNARIEKPKEPENPSPAISIDGLQLVQADLSRARSNLVQQKTEGFEALPASEDEVNDLKKYYWDPKSSGKKRILTGAKATEHVVKSIRTPPRILHLATHGFYLEDRAKVERPLLLSGLALAHANQSLLKGEKDPDGEDGILFALEAVGLQLEGTELVTLSACETARGVMDYSEGMYGLIHAFKIAGAQNILMTLTKVNDEDARTFMATFYKNWLGEIKQHPAEALRKTKLAFIGHEKEQYRDPAFWSPYVLVETVR